VARGDSHLHASTARDGRPRDEAIVITGVDRARRDVLEVYPRRDPAIPLAGVVRHTVSALTEPAGLHRVTVRESSGTRLRIGWIEAIEGTLVVDVKAVLVDCADA
jgi:tRNA (Thr-GGU) A37 N-methylase